MGISELTSTPSSPLHHLHTRCVLLCVCCCCPQWLMSWPRQESGTRGRWSGRETVHMPVRQMAAVKSDGSDHRDLVALRRLVFLLNLEDPVSAVFLDVEIAARFVETAAVIMEAASTATATTGLTTTATVKEVIPAASVQELAT